MPLIEFGPLLEAVRGLSWPARRRARGALPGAHRSRLRGVAPELSEYRLYRQGDDPRQLDWKLLARSDRAYVRLAEDRSILTTWFVLDASASMAWPPPSNDKWRLACALTLALASIAVAAGDPAGLLVAGAGGVTRLAPRARRGAIRELAVALGALAPSGSAPVSGALALAPPGTRVVLLSDFLGDESDARRIVQGLSAAGSDVQAVHVVAREELDPPVTAARAVDPEDPSLSRPFDEETREAYAARFRAWREQIAHEWRRAGAQWTEVVTGEPAERAVRRVVGAAIAANATAARGA